MRSKAFETSKAGLGYIGNSANSLNYSLAGCVREIMHFIIQPVLLD